MRFTVHLSFRPAYVINFDPALARLGVSLSVPLGAVTQTMVKGISHVNEAVVNFNVGLVYRGNMWLQVKLFPR